MVFDVPVLDRCLRIESRGIGVLQCSSVGVFVALVLCFSGVLLWLVGEAFRLLWSGGCFSGFCV
jgi:hypothetical protein